MAARAALGRAVLATAGTVVALGAATMIVSSASMGVAKMVITHQKRHLARPCNECGGNKLVKCDVCRGKKVIRYHPFRDLPVNPHTEWCACAMCSANGHQTCLNCLGEGITYMQQ